MNVRSREVVWRESEKGSGEATVLAWVWSSLGRWAYAYVRQGLGLERAATIYWSTIWSTMVDDGAVGRAQSKRG